MKEKSKSQTVQRDGGQCEPSCRRLNSALEKAGVATCPVPADIPGMRLQCFAVIAGKTAPQVLGILVSCTVAVN